MWEPIKLVKPIPKPVEPKIFYYEPIYYEDSYRAEQIRWLEAGFDAYSCDMIDEFGQW